jgi:hypothetical protein
MKKKTVFFLLLAIALAGLAGGLVGSLIFQDYFSSSNNQDILDNNLGVVGTDASRNVVIQDAKKVVVNQDVKTDEAATRARQNLVGFYDRSGVKKDFDYYRLPQPALSALLLTSDGWVLAYSPDFRDLKSLAAKFVAIGNDKKIYELDQLIIDKQSGLSFIHLSAAADLSTPNFTTRADLHPGQLLLGVSAGGSSYLTSLVSRDSLHLATASYDPEYQLSLLPEPSGADYVFDLSGAVAGLRLGKTWRPISDFQALISSILKTRTISRPTLGLVSVNLDGLVKNDLVSNRELSQRSQAGALIYSDDLKTLAVYKGGAADLAGLKAGDIVTRLDNNIIDGGHSLEEILQQYVPGQSVDLTVKRGDQTQTHTLTISEVK